MCPSMLSCLLQEVSRCQDRLDVEAVTKQSEGILHEFLVRLALQLQGTNAHAAAIGESDRSAAALGATEAGGVGACRVLAPHSQPGARTEPRAVKN